MKCHVSVAHATKHKSKANNKPRYANNKSVLYSLCRACQLSITILDWKGAKIISFSSSANTVSTLDISSLTAGTYILQIDDGEKTEFVKFVKTIKSE